MTDVEYTRLYVSLHFTSMFRFRKNALLKGGEARKGRKPFEFFLR